MTERGELRRALDRDLSKLRRGRNAIAGRDALVKLARDLADRYDKGADDEVLGQLLAVLDRLGTGKVPLIEQVDQFQSFRDELNKL